MLIAPTKPERLNYHKFHQWVDTKIEQETANMTVSAFWLILQCSESNKPKIQKSVKKMDLRLFTLTSSIYYTDFSQKKIHEHLLALLSFWLKKLVLLKMPILSNRYHNSQKSSYQIIRRAELKKFVNSDKNSLKIAKNFFN